MELALRAASAADVDGLLALWQEAAENEDRPADTRPAVAALLDRDPAAVIVAEHDGALIGSVIAGWDGCGITCTGWPSGPAGAAAASARRCWPRPRSGSRRWARPARTPWCWTATTWASSCGGPAVTSGRPAGAAG